jgi:hypothetical protein
MPEWREQLNEAGFEAQSRKGGASSGSNSTTCDPVNKLAFKE